MKIASVTHFKSHLSEYLGMLEDGQVVLITEHGRPVAQVAAPSQAARDAALGHLFRSGVMRPPVKALELAELDLIPLTKSEGGLTSAVLEERDGR